jgi:hypothetical protein
MGRSEGFGEDGGLRVWNLRRLNVCDEELEVTRCWFPLHDGVWISLRIIYPSSPRYHLDAHMLRIGTIQPKSISRYRLYISGPQRICGNIMFHRHNSSQDGHERVQFGIFKCRSRISDGSC